MLGQRLRLDEGVDLGEMQRFLDSQEEAKSTKYRLGRLPQLPAEAGRTEEGEVRVPVRQAKLMRMERSEVGRLEAYVKEEIDRAIREVNKGWGRRG